MRACWLGLALLVAACGSKKNDDASSSEAPLPVFSGKLTGDSILSAKGLVEPFDDWDRGLNKLEGKLGKATRIKGDKYQWAVMEGGTCTYFEVEKDDRSKYQKGKTGFMVGAVTTPDKFDKDGPIFNFADCKEAAGVPTGPPEDPNAPGPPSDGSAVSLQKFLDVALKARSKWDKQRVKIDARFFQLTTSTWTSGDKSGESITVHLVVDKDHTDPSVTCTLKSGEKKPEDAKQYTPVKVEGTVHVSTWVNGVGDKGLSASLEDCVVTFLPEADAKPSSSGKAK